MDRSKTNYLATKRRTKTVHCIPSGRYPHPDIAGLCVWSDSASRRRDEPERSSIIIFFSHSASLFIYPRRYLSKAATNMVYGVPRSRRPPEGREQGRISTGPSPVEHNAPIIFSPFVYPACVHCLYNVPGVGVISRLLHLLDLSFSFLFAVANGHDTIVKPKEALDDARTSRRIQRGRGKGVVGRGGGEG